MKKFEMLNLITKDCELTAKEKLVAQYFVYKSNKAGECYPCVATIAEACSVSRRTVQRATKKLAEKEYIVKEERFILGKQKSNLYTFNILLLEMEEKEERNRCYVQEEAKMEVMELTDLLQDEVIEDVPEEFIQESEEEAIDLDELAVASMEEEMCEDDYLVLIQEESTLQNVGFLEELEGITSNNQQQSMKREICFSITMRIIKRLSEFCCVYEVEIGWIILIRTEYRQLEEQSNRASRKSMGAFFPP